MIILNPIIKLVIQKLKYSVKSISTPVQTRLVYAPVPVPGPSVSVWPIKAVISPEIPMIDPADLAGANDNPSAIGIITLIIAWPGIPIDNLRLETDMPAIIPKQTSNKTL